MLCEKVRFHSHGIGMQLFDMHNLILQYAHIVTMVAAHCSTRKLADFIRGNRSML